MNNAQLQDLAHSTALRVNQRTYGQRTSSSMSYLAEIETQDRTHYYEPDTRRYFGCRVLDCHEELGGLVLGTVESVAPPNSKRLYRCVFFDLLGNVLHRTEHETNGLTGWATAKSARKEYREVLDGFDAQTIADQTIETHRQRLTRQLNQLES